MEDPSMKREKQGPDGNTHEEQLDDVIAPPTGGGGGPTPVPGDGFMETWDMVEAPQPTRAAPLQEDGEDDW